MADYKKMYYTLFNAMSKSTETMLSAMQEAEAIYISSDEPVINLAGAAEKLEECGKTAKNSPYTASKPKNIVDNL